jgi:predicted dehydrogenase
MRGVDDAMKPVKIVLAGIGGYGGVYVRMLLEGGGPVPYEFVGAVDPYAENSPHYGSLKDAQVPVYASLEQFYAASDADLAVISTPIHHHAAQTCLALRHGSNVLCEKPIAGSMADVRRMIEARDRANRFVAVGYQWSFSSAVQALKQDISSGLFGRPRRLKTIVLWPRTHRYYSRRWAGKLRAEDGTMILDSVANNATAHYLHNMFYVLGDRPDRSVHPARVTAELYRANDIENYDTAAMRAYAADGTEFLYFGSHAVDASLGAVFHYEFEDAVVRYDHGGDIVAEGKNGVIRRYGDPGDDASAKLWQCVAAVRDGRPTVCGIEAALAQTQCIAAMQRSADGIVRFPQAMIKVGAVQGDEPGTYADGLFDQLRRCYVDGVLPSEAGYAWARPGREVAVESLPPT